MLKKSKSIQIKKKHTQTKSTIRLLDYRWDKQSLYPTVQFCNIDGVLKIVFNKRGFHDIKNQVKNYM